MRGDELYLREGNPTIPASLLADGTLRHAGLQHDDPLAVQQADGGENMQVVSGTRGGGIRFLNAR